MPYLREIAYSDGTCVHLWNVTEDVEQLATMCCSRGVNADVMLAYKARNRRIEVLVEHLLLCIIFGKPVELHHTSEGRPFVADSTMHLSITHTQGLVCVAVNRHCDIGIDVERKGTRVLKVRERFLSEQEQKFIPAADAEATLIAWTAKEALYKVVNDSEATMRDDLCLEPFIPATDGMLKFTAVYRGRPFTLKTLSWNTHVLTLALESCNSPVTETDKCKPNIIEL